MGSVTVHRAPCTNLHKDEQKDRTKTLAEFPDHILNDYGIWHIRTGTHRSLLSAI